MGEVVREMLISHDSHETRVAFVEDSRLVELYIERAKKSVVGNVYLGKVHDVLPGMQAAFVDIGLEKNAFLCVDEVISQGEPLDAAQRHIQQLLRPGQQLLVQVLKDPMGTKGARITTEITLPGRFVVLMPFSQFVGVSRKLSDDERDRLHAIMAPLVPEGVGAIARTAAVGVAEQELVADIEFLTRLWKRVERQSREALAPEIVYSEMDLALRMVRDAFSNDVHRLVLDDKRLYEKVVSFLKRTSPKLVRRVTLHKERKALFDEYGLYPQIGAALERKVSLPSGGYISIDKTEALTAVDVNTSSYVGKRNLEDTIFRANLEAAEEVARQLRLRDIGGIIVIDFIDMEQPAHRTQVSERLQRTLERDRTKTRVMEMSKLGLIEMTRKNVTEGLRETLMTPCPACHGEGMVLSDTTRRVSVEGRMREILVSGRSSAYLFGLEPSTYGLFSAPGNNRMAVLRAETGKHVTIIPDVDCAGGEVRVLMEGRHGSDPSASE